MQRFPRLRCFPCNANASLWSPSFFTLLAVALLLVFSASAVARGAAGYDELPKFGRVSERLYRGAQPLKGGMSRLSRLGVNTVVNLRGAGERTRSDEAEAAALGLRYFNIPLPVWGRPEDGRVRQALEVISSPESGRVFVHCKDGVDRTGTIVALYRITAEGWTADAATDEAAGRGMRRLQVWMRDYIDDYYRRRSRARGAPTAARQGGDGRDLGDRLGTYARAGERVTFKARKTAGAFFGKVF